MTSHRIARLLEERALRECDPDMEQILAEWERAIASWEYDRTAEPAPPIHDRIGSLYTVGLRASTAVLLCAGYEIAGGSGRHHHDTFYALRGLEDESLEEAAHKMDAQRQVRHSVMYRRDEEIEAQALQDLRACVGALLSAAYDFMLARMPELSGKLEKPTISSG